MAKTLLIWLLGAATIHALNIDEGFHQDGSVTYCGGVQGPPTGKMPLPVDLTDASAGKCPVVVEIQLSQKENIPVNQPIEVNWKAKGVDVKDSLFPQAYDMHNRRPQEVRAALLKACKEGTNCDTVVDGQYIGNTQLTMTGSFGDDCTKSFPAFRFTFLENANYVFVAKVTLPGDATRNVSATEFVTFLRVAVGDSQIKLPSSSSTTTPTLTPTPSPTPSPTPTPTPTTTPSSSSNSTSSRTSSDGSGSQAAKGSTDGKNNNASKPGEGHKTGGTGSKAAGQQQQAKVQTNNGGAFSKKNLLIIGAIGAGFFVVLVGSIISVRKKRRQQALQAQVYKTNEANYFANSRDNSIHSSLRFSSIYDSDSCSDSEASRDESSASQAKGVRLLAPIDERNLSNQQHAEADIPNIDDSDTMSNFDDDPHLLRGDSSIVYLESCRSTQSDRIFTGASEVSIDSSYASEISDDFVMSSGRMTTNSQVTTSSVETGGYETRDTDSSQLSFFSDTDSMVSRQ